VLELHAQEPRHLDRRPRRARDRHERVGVGRVDLLDVARADHVVHGREPISGDEHPVGEAQPDHGRAVLHLQLAPRGSDAAQVGKQMRILASQELGKARALVAVSEAEAQGPSLPR
jgi:hypothetical protein